MARRQELHAFETGARPRHGGEGEDVIDPAPVRPRRDHAGSEQAFDFGGEEQPVALPRPEKRRDPEAVAPELELALSLIPQRDGKLPAQPLPHSLADALPKGAG